MQLSYLPDEMIDNFERGLQLGAEWGLRHVEVRLVDGVNVLDLSDEQVQRTGQLIEQYGMSVSGLATPFFKCQLPGTEDADAGPLHGARRLSYQDHLNLLPRGVEIARALGAPVMRIFSFWDDPANRDRFWQIFPEAVEATLAATAGSGVIAALENEGACFIGTSADLAEAARRLPQSDLKFIWDPGNSTRHGLPPREEDVDTFLERVALVHAKDGIFDAAAESSVAALIGRGQTDFQAELRRLHGGGYSGALTLEPHYCPEDDCVEGMRSSLDALRSIADRLAIPLG
jgi:sugar phosphate isomerase/epimerase